MLCFVTFLNGESNWLIPNFEGSGLYMDNHAFDSKVYGNWSPIIGSPFEL